LIWIWYRNTLTESNAQRMLAQPPFWEDEKSRQYLKRRRETRSRDGTKSVGECGAHVANPPSAMHDFTQ
jgi:hypothetical protein